MTLAHWFTHREHGGFPVEKAALGSCDLSVLHVGRVQQSAWSPPKGAPGRGVCWKAGAGDRKQGFREGRENMNPWDIPPFPEHGDLDGELTFAAVGRAMTEWEELELYLARLYAKFLGIPPIKAIAIPEYRDVANFHSRATVIQKAADTYFVSHPNQGREGEFAKVLGDIRQLASRRNDIAHGVVKLWWNHTETFSQAIDRNEYMLLPSTYSDKKFGDDREPAYLFQSIEINQFAEHFRQYRKQLEEIIAFFPDA